VKFIGRGLRELSLRDLSPLRFLLCNKMFPSPSFFCLLHTTQVASSFVAPFLSRREDPLGILEVPLSVTPQIVNHL
jgi:hypothetical protein